MISFVLMSQAGSTNTPRLSKHMRKSDRAVLCGYICVARNHGGSDMQVGRKGVG